MDGHITLYGNNTYPLWEWVLQTRDGKGIIITFEESLDFSNKMILTVNHFRISILVGTVQPIILKYVMELRTQVLWSGNFVLVHFHMDQLRSIPHQFGLVGRKTQKKHHFLDPGQFMKVHEGKVLQYDHVLLCTRKNSEMS